MNDTCIFCGADVSDLGVHVCSSCQGKSQSELLSDKIQSLCIKLSVYEQDKSFFLERIEKLRLVSGN